MLLQVILSTFLLTFILIKDASAESPIAFCSSVGKGTYCLPGLVGYRVCEDEELFDGEFKFCDPHQQCRCGLNRKCEGDEPVCIDLIQPPEIPRTFSSQFHGHGTIHSPHGEVKIRTSGVVYQDLENQKLCVKQTMNTGDDITTTEKLFIKDRTSNMWKKVSLLTSILP